MSRAAMAASTSARLEDMKPPLSLPRPMLKFFHPEGIPWPGTFFNSAISASGILSG
jgi:hypothetical protein